MKYNIGENVNYDDEFTELKARKWQLEQLLKTFIIYLFNYFPKPS